MSDKEWKFTVRGNANESLVIRRLQRLAAKNHPKGALEGLYIEGENTWASNGRIAACVPTPEAFKDLKGMVVEGPIPAGEFVADLEKTGEWYPDVKGIVPEAEDGQIRVTVNAQYLRWLLELIGNQDITITLRGQHDIVEVQTDRDSDNPVYALLMPLNMMDTVIELMHPYMTSHVLDDEKARFAAKDPEVG